MLLIHNSFYRIKFEFSIKKKGKYLHFIQNPKPFQYTILLNKCLSSKSFSKQIYSIQFYQTLEAIKCYLILNLLEKSKIRLESFRGGSLRRFIIDTDSNFNQRNRNWKILNSFILKALQHH